MSDVAPLIAKITSSGVTKVFGASTSALSVHITHMAYGSGINGQGYNPTGQEVALKSEFVRFPIGSGDRIDSVLFLQGVLQAPHNQSGWVSEIGLFLDDGTLFAVYSENGAVITYVGQNDNIAQAISLGLEGLPSDAVSWTASGPTVNLFLGEPLTNMAIAIAGLQAKLLATDVSRLTPIISSLQAGK